VQRRPGASTHALASIAWFACVSLILVQFDVACGFWLGRDLPAGDARSYYTCQTTVITSPL
jgi:hypothetical protein